MNFFGWTLGGFYLARYDGAPACQRHAPAPLPSAGGWFGCLAVSTPGCHARLAAPGRLAAAAGRRGPRAPPPPLPRAPADSPVGAFDECVALAGLAWNFPTSCAWAARVYVNNRRGAGRGGGKGPGSGRLLDPLAAACPASAGACAGRAGSHVAATAAAAAAAGRGGERARAGDRAKGARKPLTQQTYYPSSQPRRAFV